MSRAPVPVPLTGVSLSGIDIFQGLDPEHREAVAKRCRCHRYPPGSRILSHEDTGGDVYFIVSGDVIVHHYSRSGKEITFRDEHAGEIFGELAAIDGAGRTAHVESKTEVVAAAMSRRNFLQVLQDYPQVAMATLSRLTKLVRALSDRVIEFSTLGVKNRIHAELLRLASEHVMEGNTATIAPAPKHADIASRISTHREAVTRELNELARAGLLERAPNALVILDLSALEKLVQELRSV